MRSGEQDELLVTERFGVQAAAAGAHGAHDEVQSAIDEVGEQVVGESEPGPDRDTGRDDVGEGRQDPGGEQVRGPAEVQRAAGDAGAVDQARRDADERVEGPVEAAGQVVGGRGGCHAASLPDEQRLPELPLEGAHLSGHGGLGQMESAGSTRQCPGPVHRQERAQQVQRDAVGHPCSVPHPSKY